MSDLHLETPKIRPAYEEFKIEPQCQYLALLGDIGNVLDSRFFAFLEEQLQHFEIVFYLLGNHEPYGMDLPTARASVRAFAENIEQQHSLSSPTMGRFVFLDRTRYDLMNNWTMDTHCAAHEADMDWPNLQVAQIKQHEPYRSIVIFTHYSPTLLAAANDHIHLEDATQVQSAFVTNLSDQVCWTSAQVRLWAFGHTHFNCDFMEPRTGKRVFANQKGYQRTKVVTFSATKVVSIDGKARGGKKDLEVEGFLSKKSKQKTKRCSIL